MAIDVPYHVAVYDGDKNHNPRKGTEMTHAAEHHGRRL